MIKKFFQFIKSKTFFKHLLIYIIVVSILLWLISMFLSTTTKHGETVKVPDFNKLKIAELDNFVKDKQVKYVIIDSIYAEKLPKGTIVRQEPEAGSDVKDGRTIYLYVTSTVAPSIQMPKLVDRSLRQAASMIESYQLKLGAIKYVSDQCANCVLEQMVKGKKIAPGQPVKKGTVITLVVGKGLGDEEVGVPCLYGLTKKEAIERLVETSLSAGAISFDNIKDSAKSRVYRQIPACGKEVMRNMGSSVDLFFTTDNNKIPASGNSPSKGDLIKEEIDFDE